MPNGWPCLRGVVSDLHGVAARAMIDCLLGGGTPEQALAHAGRLRAPKEEVLASLQGELSEEHLFVAGLIRRHIDVLETQLADLERHLLEGLKPQEAALQLLLTIPGIDRVAAARLLVEIGDDMAVFGRPDRLAQGAGVCPGKHESAGKRNRGNPAPGNLYVRTVLCESRGQQHAPPVNSRAVFRAWLFVGEPRRPLSPSAIKCSK